MTPDQPPPAHPPQPCKTCGGSGRVHSHNPECWDCNGTGKIPHPPHPDRPPGAGGVQSFNEETDPDCGLRYMRMTHDGNFVKRMDYAALDAYAKRLERRVEDLEGEKDRAWRQYNTIRDEQAANFEKWFGIIGGVGLTGYQPECATSIDLACRELVALRQRCERLREILGWLCEYPKTIYMGSKYVKYEASFQWDGPGHRAIQEALNDRR